MTKRLWTVRLKSFAYSAGTLIVMGVLGVLTSDQFLKLLQEYTGTAFWGTLVILIAPELAKHIRNKVVAGSAIVGAIDEAPEIDLI